MATWDGSDQAGPSENPNYYLSAHGNSTAANSQAWNYYSAAGNGAYPHGSIGLYTQNNLPNVASTPNFQTAVYQDQMISPILDNTALHTDERPCLFENNRTLQKHQGYNNRSGNYSYKRHNDGGELKNKYSSEKQDPRLMKQSYLHAEANEFVPTVVKNSQKNSSTYDNYGDNQQNDFTSSNIQNSQIFFSDNRYRFNDRRYDNAKNSNSYRGSYKNQRPRNYDKPFNGQRNYDPTVIPLEDSTGNFQPEENRSDPKVQRQRNNGRFQNDRYTGNRQQNDKLRSDRRNLSVDPHFSQNSLDTFKDNTMSNDEPRDNANRSAYNNKGRWTRNDKRMRNDRYQNNRQQNDKPRSGSRETEHDEHQDLEPRLTENTSTGTRREIVQNRDVDRMYKTNNRRGRQRDRSANSDGNGYSYREYNDNYDREMKFDRSRDDIKMMKEPRNEEPLNWRQKEKAPNRPVLPKKSNKKWEIDDDASQRERLTELLNQGRLECLICCDYIRQNDPVWSCGNCYHVLHLKCLKKWAHSSQGENGWRCPACQNVSLTVPEVYHCFCGKARAPEWNRRDVAHSCGEICGRFGAKNNCAHKCTLLCHPGSCPECIAMVTRQCQCGKTSQSLKCSTMTLVVCEATCDKSLNCNMHSCEKTCHLGECGPCEKTIHQECFCGKHERDVTCIADLPWTYSCEEVCDKLLECGNHRCKEMCHPGSCGTCTLLPTTVTHCCCGQTPLAEKRESCLDPISMCGKVCSKKLKCGQPSDPHTCKADCHPGDCPECELTTKVRCRCGNMDREIACKELRTKADDARCEKKCTKKRSCGKHKCNQPCCIDIEHICPMPCSKTLSCGRHRCQLCCHKGRCQPCQEMSFDELYCECGASVIYPPVACGTRRPTCNRPCTRQHECGHEVLHNCHSDPTCPPCTVLTQKWCYGKHELRKAVPCHVNEISCGMPCNKPVSCGRHKCITLCHSGPCEKSGQICVQSCTTPREMCGHACAAPCHEGRCPDTPCKEMVKVTCTCGHRSMTRACAENSREFQRIASGILASKMADMQLGHSVDLEEVFGQGVKKQNQLKTLECNDECKVIERNRRLSLALQIANPDLSGKLMPRYTDSMKLWAKKDPHFCQMVHDKLTELVHLAKTSKQKSRSYSFDSMNRDKRNFVHESCEQFGCESQAYDREPKRNVVATAVKDKCWLPSYSLLEIVQRENGQRKVPRPMLNSSKPNTTIRESKVLSSTAKASQKLQPAASSSSKSPEPEIDYFDFPNEKAGKWSNV